MSLLEFCEYHVNVLALNFLMIQQAYKCWRIYGLVNLAYVFGLQLNVSGVSDETLSCYCLPQQRWPHPQISLYH